MLQFVFHSGGRHRDVPACVQKLLRRVAADLADTFQIRELLQVHVYPSVVVYAGDDAGFGRFIVVDGRPQIRLAAGLRGCFPRKSPDLLPDGALLEVLAHELVHYEQHRAGLPVAEDDTAVDARAHHVVCDLARRHPELNLLHFPFVRQTASVPC